MKINGEKISLRLMNEDDTDLIVGWRNNLRVRNNFIYQKPFTRDGHEHWVRTMVDTGKVVQFIIEDLRTGQPVGSVYFRDIDKEHKKAEYGIFIGEDSAVGKGLGSEAARMAVEYGFEKLMLHKIFLRVFADNLGAIRSYEKAGFVKEGYFKDDVCIDGEFKDLIFMAIVNE